MRGRVIILRRDGEVEGCALAEHVHVLFIHLFIRQEYPSTLMNWSF